MVLDICVFETLQCAWFHYFLPSLAKDEVRRAKKVVEQVLYNMTGQHNDNNCNNEVHSNTQAVRTQRQMNAEAEYSSRPVAFSSHSLPTDPHVVCRLLNAPDYLFVSSQLAGRHPCLLESQLVRSYASVWPGAVRSRRWRMQWIKHAGRSGLHTPSDDHVHTQAARLLSRLLLPQRIFIYLVLQVVVHAPIQVQSILIRVTEPVLLSGFFFLLLLLWNQVLYLAIACALLCMVCGYLLWQHWYSVSRQTHHQVASDLDGDDDYPTPSLSSPLPPPSANVMVASGDHGFDEDHGLAKALAVMGVDAGVQAGHGVGNDDSDIWSDESFSLDSSDTSKSDSSFGAENINTRTHSHKRQHSNFRTWITSDNSDSGSDYYSDMAESDPDT
ncbi:hypothetical protein EON63_01030 [archaeon]|nr:MAG: hypothetical protein EON63_01030 [archaeon]